MMTVPGGQRWPANTGGAVIMATVDPVNLASLLDDAKCFALVRQHRWPEGVRCPGCGSDTVIRNGCDDTQPQRQRYRCKVCAGRFDDLTGTVLAGHHQPLRVWVLCLSFMGLNLSNRQIALELKLSPSDAQAMTEQLRRGQTGRSGRRRKLAGAPGRGTLEKDKPPILGLIQRGGPVVLPMVAHVQQTTIEPVITAVVARGTLIHTDEYGIYARLPAWGYQHKTVCHARGEYARDEDGDGFCEVHVNTIEGTWSLLRSWLRPHRGISQEKLPLYLGFFEFVHNARRRGKALLGALVAALVM